jgi:bifunctional enzyme CysN/CysC
MTGIDSPYEEPEAAELVLTPADGDADAQAALVLAALAEVSGRAIPGPGD